MLTITTLTKKPEATNAAGEKVVDLSSSTFQFNGDITIVGTGLVSDELEMRADLVAKIYYGNSNKFDHILKFNGISNPFSLEAGTVLLIGDEAQLDACFTKSSSTNSESNKEDIRKRFFDPNKLSKKDAKRLELMKKKSEGANAANLTPPNIAEPGAKEISVKDGMVMFGTDVVANKENCPVPLSKATVKAKLLQNKIFRNSQ